MQALGSMEPGKLEKASSLTKQPLGREKSFKKNSHQFQTLPELPFLPEAVLQKNFKAEGNWQIVISFPHLASPAQPERLSSVLHNR